MSHSEIGLLIVNYNGMKFLPSYLQQITTDCKENSIQLLVCDDQSTDGSVEFLTQNEIPFLSNISLSHGYAANANMGLKELFEHSSCKYFIVANNDICLSKDLFKKLHQVLSILKSKTPDLGLVGFNEVIANNNDQLFKQIVDNEYPLPERVYEIPGFFFLITRELLAKIGYMDEEYFMYGEDNDYYIRTIKAGFSIFQSHIPIFHFSEGSSTNIKLTSWYVYRNAFLFAQKNLGWKGVLKIFFSFINQIYNPFFKQSNPGNIRVVRNGFFYNNYLLFKSILWNIRYYIHKRPESKA